MKKDKLEFFVLSLSLRLCLFVRNAFPMSWSRHKNSIKLPWKQKQYVVPQWRFSYQQARVSYTARPDNQNKILVTDQLSLNTHHEFNIEAILDFEVTSKTSRPTRNMGFSFRCSTSATSSITGPLLQFIRIASYRFRLQILFSGKIMSTQICNLINKQMGNLHSPSSSLRAAPC